MEKISNVCLSHGQQNCYDPYCNPDQAFQYQNSVQFKGGFYPGTEQASYGYYTNEHQQSYSNHPKHPRYCQRIFQGGMRHRGNCKGKERREKQYQNTCHPRHGPPQFCRGWKKQGKRREDILYPDEKIEQQKCAKNKQMKMKKEQSKDQNFSNQSQSESSEEQLLPPPPAQYSQEGLQQLKLYGFDNQNTNIALLCYFKNDIQKIIECFSWCGSQQAIMYSLSKYQSNFIILECLEYTQKLPSWKVLRSLENSQNNLKVAMSKLDKMISNINHSKKVEGLVKDYHFNMVETIPPPAESIWIIDASNVVRANRHLKNLIKVKQPKSKLEAFLRLKTLVQTITSGYLVFDVKILDDAAQKQILKQIDVEINAEKKIKVIYADPGKKADDKIIQIVKQMTQQERKKILMVTSDRLLLKECQDMVGKDMPIIGGHKFIKQCKKHIPRGLKNKIIRGMKKDRNLI